LNKKITIIDVAKKSDYSLMTVSRAINNSPLVKEKTKNKILRVAKKLGYIQDAIGVSLVKGKTRLIGLVVIDSANPFYAKLIHGIENIAVEKGYHVILFNTNEELNREVEAIKLLIGLRAEGILIVPCQKSHKHLLQLKRNGLPFITISRRIREFETNYILNDNAYGSYIATKHLIELGHKEIAFIGGNKHVSTRKDRLKGYKKALKEQNINIKNKLIIDSNISYSSGAKSFCKILDSGNRITGIVAYNDVVAIGIMFAANERGLSVPEEISIVGYDNIEITKFIFPRLTTISQPLQKLGEIYCNSIINLIDDKKEIVKEIIKPKLVVRDTTANPYDF